MPKIPYKIKTLQTVNKTKLRKDVIQAQQSSPELRKEIARVFQMANRRIQNIEAAGLMSPAVAALNKGDIDRYSKFSMSGDWNTLKIEYGKAVAFLRQPTSTVSGVRQYNQHLQQAYDLTADEFNLMARQLQGRLSSLSDSSFVERYLMRYKDFTGEMEQSASDISTQIESEAERLARALDNDIERTADEVVKQVESIEDNMDRIMRNFAEFGL